LQLRAPYYYEVLPELHKVMDDCLIGIHHLPPSKADGYLNVNAEQRERYSSQSSKLWEELEMKLPKDIVANIRKEFKYGL